MRAEFPEVRDVRGLCLEHSRRQADGGKGRQAEKDGEHARQPQPHKDTSMPSTTIEYFFASYTGVLHAPDGAEPPGAAIGRGHPKVTPAKGMPAMRGRKHAGLRRPRGANGGHDVARRRM